MQNRSATQLYTLSLQHISLNSCGSSGTLLFSNVNSYMRGDQKVSGIFTKNLFKIFIQVYNFSHLQSTPPVTGCSNPSGAPTAGKIV
jgi:hypothetical protein